MIKSAVIRGRVLDSILSTCIGTDVVNVLKACTINLMIAAGLLAGPATAAASSYPERPIRVVIPFPPGGFVDTIIRSLGPGVSEELGVPVIVENRPGGGAQIAGSAVKNSPADGYTIFAGEIGALAINPSLYKNLTYDPRVDFEPMIGLLKAPMVMYAHPDGKLGSSTRALSETLAETDLYYASTGPGTGAHILGHLVSRNNPAAEFTHIPYKGAPPAAMAVLSGEVDFSFDAVGPVLNLHNSQKAVALAVAAKERSPFFPDVPTTAEIGEPNVVMEVWTGLVLKKGTPPEVVERVSAAFSKAMDDPAVLSKFRDQGWSRFSISGDKFGHFIESEIERYRPIIADSGAVVD